MKKYRFPVSEPPAVGRQASIAGTDADHIRKVLRLGPGARIFLFDGSGTEYEARITAVEANRVLAEVTAANHPNRESPVRIAVAQGILKEKKMDRVIRQLTELGADAWIPFAAERSVARPDPQKVEARTQRWRKIAVEAAKQSRRLKVPEIFPAADFDQAIGLAEVHALKIAFWEEARIGAGWPAPHHGPRSVFLLVGPEGGFTADEIAAAESAGFLPASLGPRILRAETAAVVACALAQHRYGDLGRPSTSGAM
ncbi:MAG: 16S rRNA (uracil(1498)-N(3))-methyltransferase [Desulfobacterales bacterium]|jgi:16S rRNA (uracil1498-N3)-methyltransferase